MKVMDLETNITELEEFIEGLPREAKAKAYEFALKYFEMGLDLGRGAFGSRLKQDDVYLKSYLLKRLGEKRSN